MEEKRKDLKINRQKSVITEIVMLLNETHPSFYYLSTVEIAGEIKKFIEEPNSLSRDKLDLIKGLSQHDIQILMSLHD